MLRVPVDDGLEALAVRLIESREAVRINVEDSDEIAFPVDHRNHDFGLRTRVAGNVSGKRIHVVHDYRLPFGRSCAAYAATEVDLHAAERSLIRSDTKQLPRFDDTIEPRPQMAEAVVNQCADRRHCCDLVIDSLENCVDLSSELGVRLRAG